MTLMYINVINVTYTYIMLHTIKSTYLMTVYCLHGAAPISLYLWAIGGSGSAQGGLVKPSPQQHQTKTKLGTLKIEH
jgi:hypothetical protein